MNNKPETYWEERCEVLEGFVIRLASVLIANLPACRPTVVELISEWEKILVGLDKEYKTNETSI
jgi:hypothetical protein